MICSRAGVLFWSGIGFFAVSDSYVGVNSRSDIDIVTPMAGTKASATTASGHARKPGAHGCAGTGWISQYGSPEQNPDFLERDFR